MTKVSGEEEKESPVTEILPNGTSVENHDSGEEGQRLCFQSWRRGPKAFFFKYFLEGQAVNKRQQLAIANLDPDTPFLRRILVTHRRLLGFLLPALFFHAFWWAFMIYHNTWHLFRDKYQLTITMVFASLLAGMTSVGGGVLAFAVMTLAMDISPPMARDFSVMIQSCGLSAATFSIIFMRIQVEWITVSFCMPSGAAGIIVGLHFVETNLTSAQKKMIFASTWLAFSFIIIILNLYHKRRTFATIPNFRWWKGVVLAVVGFCGGIFTSFAGSGMGMSVFAILTLMFRVSEKTAAPTGIILLAGNSLVAWMWRGLMMEQLIPESLEYLAVTIPVVVVGAPFGSVMGSHFHRLVLATLMCMVNIATVIGAYCIVDLTWKLVVLSIAIILGGLGIFVLITYTGQIILRGIEKRELKDTECNY